MKRITFKQVKERCSEINAARGIEDDTIGALKAEYNACGCSINRIINNGHGATRLYGADTPRRCMEYLNYTH